MRARVPLPDVGEPFAEDGAVDQRVVPHGDADGRSFKRDLPDGGHRDHRDLAVAQHLDAVVGGHQQRILQVDDVALEMERQDLPRAAAHHLVAISEARQQNAALVGLLPVPHDVMARFQPAPRVRQGEHGRSVGIVQTAPELQLAQHGKERCVGIDMHVVGSARAGAQRLSAMVPWTAADISTLCDFSPLTRFKFLINAAESGN